MKCREFKCGNCAITQNYKTLTHRGVDMVALIDGKHASDYVTAHSDGKVVWKQTGQKNNPKATGNASYGNCIKIKHANGYYTLYAHLSEVNVSLNQNVKRGQVIGHMGNTGKSYGAHLHWEVRNTKDNRINPEPYINADLPIVNYTYQVYDNVKKKWLPKVTFGNTDYAGNFGHAIGGLRMTNKRYRAHDKVKKTWLPWVTGDSDYAGNLGHDIDGIQVEGASYRVHLKGGGWLSWVNKVDNTPEGYAGIIGKSIDAVELK